MTIAFVAGATGYTGRAVVEALRQRGVVTHAHVRPDSPRLAEWRERFLALGATVDATPWEPEAMRATLTRIAPTHVFALLGTTQARVRAEKAVGRRADYEAVDFGLTALLLDAAEGSGARPRFVYLSAVGVGPKAHGAYYQARQRLEERLEKSGLPFAIARPSFITGPGRDAPRPAEHATAEILDGVLGVLAALGATKLAARYHSTDNRALAVGLVRIGLDVAANRVFTSEELR